MNADDESHARTRAVIDLWLAEPATDPDERARHLLLDQLFSGEERNRFSCFARSSDRELFFTTRLLARVALAHATSTSLHAWRLRSDRDGRPTADGPHGVVSPMLSLSHTPGLVACAVRAAGLVGVDVEHLDRAFDPLRLARRHLAPAEVDDLVALASPARPERFLRYWTLKEAYLKARGIGLRVPMKDVAIDLSMKPDVGLRLGPSLADDRDSWTMRSFRPTARHVGAIAIAGADPTALHIEEHRTRARALIADALRD